MYGCLANCPLSLRQNYRCPVFFFSSRRRHTRCSRDWCSDVCSSDLSFIRMARLAEPLMHDGGTLLAMSYHGANKVVPNYNLIGPVKAALESAVRYLAYELGEKHRSEERRVGKECRYRWSRFH